MYPNIKKKKLIKLSAYKGVAIILCQEEGPTVVGDEQSDKQLMDALNAKKHKYFGNNT